MNLFKTSVRFLSLVKISHTVFSLPFAMIGFFLAVQESGFNFSWWLLLYVVLAVFFARNAAMAFNRFADRKIDAENPRTAVREIPQGLLNPASVLFFVILNSLLFMGVAWLINPLCFYLSPIALLVVLGYSFTKRFTFLCHLFLGLGLALSPIGAYLAMTARFDLIPLFFSFAVFFWVSGFDILYSLQDEEHDRGEGLHSIPSRYGRKNALIISAILHVFCLMFLTWAGYAAAFNWIYWAGLIVFASLLLYQHLIVKPHDISRVNMAFATLNGLASIIFGAVSVLSFYFPA